MFQIPYSRTRADFLGKVRPFIIDAGRVRECFEGVRYAEDAERILGVFKAASTHYSPPWYRVQRPTDRYIMTLPSREVLAWARDGEDGPLELVAWTDAFQCVLIWKEEPRGPRLVSARR